MYCVYVAMNCIHLSLDWNIPTKENNIYVETVWVCFCFHVYMHMRVDKCTRSKLDGLVWYWFLKYFILCIFLNTDAITIWYE